MKFNTALALTVLGGSLLLVVGRPTRRRTLGLVGAAVVLAIGLLTLVQYVLVIDLGIDELIFRDVSTLGTTNPGRMAWNSAAVFSLLAAGVLLLRREWPGGRRPAQWLALAALIFPMQALLGYLYGRMSIVGLGPGSGYMAVPTAVGFICAAVAILFAEPDKAVMATVTADTRGSAVFRLFLFGAILLPPVLGWIALHSLRGRYHSPEYSVGTVALLTTCLFVALTWFNATRVNLAERAVEQREQRYAHLVEHLPDVVFRLDHSLRHLYISPVVERFYELPPEAFPGKTLREVGLPEEICSHFDRICRQAFLKGREQAMEFDYRGRSMLTRVIPERGGEAETLLGLTADITERKEAEAALRESGQRYETLFNSIDEGFCVVEVLFDEKQRARDYRFLETNPAFEAQTGLKDAVGKTMRELAPAHEEHWFAIYGRVALTGEPIRFENGAGALDRWFDVYALRVGGPASRRVAIVFSDITKRRRTEEALRESQQRLSALLRQLPLGVGLADLEGRWLVANPMLRSLVASDVAPSLDPAAHMRWRSWRVDGSVLEPADWPGARALRGETVRGLDFLHTSEGGAQTWKRISAAPFRNAAGDVVGTVIVIEDIDQQKRAEEGLKESEERFRTLAENIPQLAWMTQPDGWVFWYNRRWFDYTGTTLEQMQGWGWQAVHHPEHAARVTEKFKAALERGTPWEDTFPLRSKEGQYRWFLSRAFPIRDRNGQIVRWFGTNTDITALREAQEGLNQAQAELRRHAVNLEKTVAERTAKLQETVGELEAFSYSIAHDMRAPLRAMEGFASLLMTDYGPHLDETAQSYLERIGTAARRMDGLIMDILSYSKIVRGELELQPVDVEKLIREVIPSYPSLQSDQADISVEGPLPRVMANEAALIQVISNLLGNAVKFVSPGVRPRVRVRAERADDHVRLWFEDNGIGIAKDLVPRLFNIFVRLNRPALYEGTGIGLAIVRKAVERMGGSAGVESEPGQGSRFWVELQAPKNGSWSSN